MPFYVCVRECFHANNRYREGQVVEFSADSRPPKHFKAYAGPPPERVEPEGDDAPPAFVQGDTSWADAANAAQAAPKEPEPSPAVEAVEELVTDDDLETKSKRGKKK